MAGKVSLAWLLAAGFCLSSCGDDGTAPDESPPPGAPVGLDYPDPNMFVEGEPITPLVPRLYSGTSSNYWVYPELPPGLKLDGRTGVISGTPTEGRAQATYSVTADNPLGRSDFGVRITISGRFTVGGVVIGLTGTGLVLNNYGEDLPVNSTGKFTFTQVYPAGTGFIISVKTQPTGQSCAVIQGSGYISNVDYGETIVSCSNNAGKAQRVAGSWSDFAIATRADIPVVTCFYPSSPETISGHVVDPATGRVTLLGELIYDATPGDAQPPGCEPRLVKLDSTHRWAYVSDAKTRALRVYSTEIASSK